MRPVVAIVLILLLSNPVCAKRLQLSAQGSTALTFNDNITLSRSDVNFGPSVLAVQDLLGVARVRTSLRLDDTTELAYTGSRTHFYKNTDLGYAENVLELTHEQVIAKKLQIQAQALAGRVDPDSLVRADKNGVFPFTTSEAPDRQVAQLQLGTPRGKPTEVSLRGLVQDQQYKNNPLLNSEARALQLKLGQQAGEHWSGGVDGQVVSRHYVNLVGPGQGTIIEAEANNIATQVSYLPNKHFGFLAKSLWLDQNANVDAFFLDQQDVSVAASWDSDAWGSASLLGQRSRRSFARRPAPGGESQLDHDLLLIFSVTKSLGVRSAATVGYTYDRNRSNVTAFDYSNNIVRIELSRSF